LQSTKIAELHRLRHSAVLALQFLQSLVKDKEGFTDQGARLQRVIGTLAAKGRDR
jgi:hypothetical protein